MKKEPFLTAVALALFATALVGCSVIDRGLEGNIYEKMTIFSMILLTVFAIIVVPFASKADNKLQARYRELIRNARPHPIAANALTGYPVYVWDSRKSFYKMVFTRDGSLSQSPIVTANGQDPQAAPTGTWALAPDGILRLSFHATKGFRDYTCISVDGYCMATLMRLKSGYAESWYLGEQALAQAQISCFGYSDSMPAAGKFTRSLVSGLTVYWGTYPCIVPTATSEVSINPELAFGVITFHEDGTLSKSINNPLDAVPDFKPSFKGTWKVDEDVGVLNLSVGLYSTEVTLLLHSEKCHSLLVGTTAGNEQWFVDLELAGKDLANYLAIGIYLDEGESSRFRA
jgi:hypothetical protein